MNKSFTLTLTTLAVAFMTACTPVADAPTDVTASPSSTTAYVHTITLDDVATQAWSAFDAADTASTLPNHNTKVELIGMNTTGFPYATENMRVVSDSTYYYLFAY